MNTGQWIQIIFSGALVLATGILAWITYGYMTATKRMSDSMNRQSIIMQKEFEIRLMPLVEENISKIVTTGPKPTAYLTISNKGFYPVYCADVEIKLSNNENKDDFVIEPMNFGLWLEGGHEKRLEISFDFGRLSSFSRNSNISGKATAMMTFNYRSINNSEIHQIKFVRY